MADGKIIIETGLDDSGIKSDLGKLGSLATKGGAVAVKAIAGVSAALVAAGGFAAKVGMDFESQMSRVKAISGATGEDFEKLKEQAIELGASTAFSASEAAQGMENLASAGFTTAEIMEAMPGMLDLAASSGEDLASSSDIAASTLRGFGLAASEASHVADVLAKNAADTNAAVADTGEAMKYVAPVAKAMGISFEETAAAIGIMADAGIKGSQAGTTIRGALSRLVKPTKKMSELMEDLGLSFFDNEGKMLSLTDMTAMLKDKTSGLTEEQRNNAMVTLFGQESLSGMLALMEAGPEKLANLTSSYEDCDGAAKDMAKTMQDNLKSTLEEVGGAAETMAIRFYDSVSGNLKGAAEEAIVYINSITSAFESGGLEGAITKAGDIFAELAVKAAQQAPKMVDTAVSFIKAFAAGIVKNRRKLYKAGEDVVKAVADGFIKLLPKELQRPAERAVKSVINIFKNLASSVGQITRSALPPLVKILGFAADHIEEFGSVALIAVAAIKAFKVATSVTKAVKGLKGAFDALSASMLANPIGLVAAAIAALATAFVVANLRSDEYLSASELRQKKLDEENKILGEQVDALNEVRDERQKTVSGIESESGYYRDLWSEMQTIVDQNGKIKKGHEERAQTIATLLSEELGITIDVVDGQIQKYGELQESIDALIEKKRQEALLSAYQSDYEEALKNRAEAEETVAQKLKERDTALRNLASAQAYYDGITNGTIQVEGDYSEACVKAEEAIEDKRSALDKAKTAYGDAKEALNLYTNDISNYEAAMGAVKSGSENASLYVTQMSHDFVRASGDNKQALQDQVDNFRQGWQDMKTAAQQEGSGVTDATVAQYHAMYLAAQGELAKGSGATEEQITSWMNSAKAVLESAGLSAVGAEVAQETVDGVTETLEAGAEPVEGAAANTTEAINEGAASVDTSETGSQKADDFIESETAGLDAGTEDVYGSAASAAEKVNEGAASVDTTTVASTIGSETVQALISALATLEETTRTAATDITNAVNQGLVSGGTEGATQAANGIGTAYAAAILAQQGAVINAGRQLALSVNAGTKTANATADGANVGTTFVSGVSSKNGSATAAGRALATAAQTGAGGVNSTQKGVTFGAWFISGIASKISSAKSAGTTLARNAESGAGSVNPNSKGSTFGGEFVSGINSKKDSAKSAGTALADNAKAGLNTVGSGYDYGSNFAQGFVNGINDKKESAEAAAAAIANIAKTAAANALAIKSPSREMYKIGQYFDDGFINAIDDGAKDAEKAARNMSLSALNAVDISAMVENMRAQIRQESINLGAAVTTTLIQKVTGTAKIEQEEKASDRRRLAEDIVDAFARSGITVQVDDWTFGKLVKEV